MFYVVLLWVEAMFLISLNKILLGQLKLKKYVIIMQVKNLFVWDF